MGLFFRLEEFMKQEVGSVITIIDPAIVNIIHSRNIKSLICEIKNEGNGFYFSMRSAGDYEKRSIRLLPYSKDLRKIRTPIELIKFNVKSAKVFRSIFTEDPDEIFRIEPIEFSDHGFTVPYFTRSGLVIPFSYANSYLDERAGMVRACYNETTTPMIEAGELTIYLTEENTPLSFAMSSVGKCIRSWGLGSLRKTINKTDKLIEDFIYVKTIQKDQFHKYGVMVFKEQKNG